MAIRVTPLGAGRQVGRSCILLELAGCRILLDCGVNVGTGSHMPELDVLVVDGVVALDVVVISHFHLDHIGALPYLTEVLGYTGPLLMTHPTRAIAPLLIRDYLRMAERRGRPGSRRAYFTQEMVEDCFARATCMQLQERVVVRGLAVTPFYAGHVLGAAMLLLECRGRSALYTGDFTTVPDHHLSAARLPLALRPDVMITESTYCTTVRSSKRAKEQDLCRKIQETLDKGGKVLMPIFMIGRAQEMCLLCEKHWERAQLNYPIYIIRGMAEKALGFFRLFASWSSDVLRKSEEPFNFAHVNMCDLEDVLESSSPMVVFAGPSMLQGGSSLQIFKKWAPDRGNLLVFAGYCLPGTVGNEVQARIKQIQVDGDMTVAVRCAVEYMSHSDHTDSRGILQLIAQVAPRHVVLVHGTEKVMQAFKPIVERRLRIPCSDPAVGECLDLGGGEAPREVLASPLLVVRAVPVPGPPPAPHAARELPMPCCPPCFDFSGVLVRRKRGAQEAFELVERTPRAVAAATGLSVHRLRFRHEEGALPLAVFRQAWARLEAELRRSGAPYSWDPAEPPLEGQLPPGDEAFTLCLLESMRCCLRPGGKAGHARLTVEWTREDEQQTDAVERFLADLERE